FQINLNKSPLASTRLRDHINGKKNFIGLIQEPPFKNDKCTHLENIAKSSISYFNQNEAPRAAILASDNLSFWPKPDLSNKDFSTALVMNKCSNVKEWQKNGTLVVSGYWEQCCSPKQAADKSNLDKIPNILRKIVAYARTNHLGLIIGMDANCHSGMFGSPSQNHRGDVMDEFVISNELIPLNKGNTPTWNNKKSSSIIDISMTNDRLVNKIQNWRVNTQIFISDHKIIEFKLANFQGVNERRRDFTQFSPSLFNEVILRCLGDWNSSDISFNNTEDIDKALEWYDKVITSALDICAPFKSVNIKTNHLSFWCEELQNAKDKEALAYRNFQSNANSLNEKLLKAAKKEFRRNKQYHQRKSWRKFTSTTDTIKNVAKLNKILNNKKQLSIGLLSRDDDSFTESPKESLELIMQKNFPGCKTVEKSCVKITNFEFKEHSWICLEVLKEIIKNLQPHKAAGPDGNKPLILQSLPDVMLNILLKIFNAVISSKYTPRGWCESEVVLLKKPGKSDYTKPKAFRPITLANHSLKLLERLCLVEMDKSTFNLKKYEFEQHAFQTGRSCESACLEAVTFIENAILTKKQLAICVDLDIIGAFNEVRVESIITQMKNKGVNSDIVDWYENYITNRIAVVNIKGEKIIKKIDIGTPQGGVLSVVAWNIVFDDLIRRVKALKNEVKIIGYADDAKLLAEGGSIAKIMMRLNITLRVVSNWAEDSGLKISTEKSSAMLFTKKRRSKLIWPEGLHLKVQGNKVNFVAKSRYLGLIFDENLTWTPHVLQKIKEAKQNLGHWRRSVKANWAPHQSLLKWVWEQCIMPKLTYGCTIWGPTIINSSTIMKKLNSLQGCALSQLGLFRKNVPRKALEVVTGTEPLYLAIEKLMIMGALRNISFLKKQGKTNGILRDKIRELKLPTGVDKIDLVDKTKTYKSNKFSLTISDGRPNLEADLVAFTDGSRKGGQVGCGFHLKILTKFR
ncbi:MAG: reverse transcriptase family protein, partial [Bacteroidota bacterium]